MSWQREQQRECTEWCAGPTGHQLCRSNPVEVKPRGHMLAPNRGNLHGSRHDGICNRELAAVSLQPPTDFSTIPCRIRRTTGPRYRDARPQLTSNTETVPGPMANIITNSPCRTCRILRQLTIIANTAPIANSSGIASCMSASGHRKSVQRTEDPPGRCGPWSEKC